MEENTTEQQQAQLKQVESFYNAIVNNLKSQIADMADQKAVQFVQSQQTMQGMQETMQNMQDIIKDLEQKVKELSEKIK